MDCVEEVTHMAKMKEDPLWMRITAGVILRVIWAVIGFFTPIVGLSMGGRTLMIFPKHYEDGLALLFICLTGGMLGALLGPLLYVPKFREGTGSLNEVRRMSGCGKSKRNDE